MKCIAVVVFVALAACTQAAPSGLGLGLGLGLAGNPWAYSGLPLGTPGIGQYSTVNLAGYHSALPYAAHIAAPAALPYAYASHNVLAHNVVAAPHAAIAVAPLGAAYTAATRGAVHTAPLPGHAVSQTSLNLAPAPGTW